MRRYAVSFYNVVSGSFRTPDALHIICSHLCAGIDRDAESRDVVPGLDDPGGERVGVDLKLSPDRLSPDRRDDHSERGVGCFEPQQICESVEQELFDKVAPQESKDPYADFAFGLDGATNDELELLVASGLGHSSTLETFRHLESSMGPPTGAGATEDPIPMDLDLTLLKPTLRRPPPGERETRRGCQLNSNPLGLLPFQPPTPAFSTLPFPSLLSPARAATPARNRVFTDMDSCSLLDSPTKAVPGASQISTAASVTKVGVECAETSSVLMNLDLGEPPEESIAGPRLFQLLDDDGME